MNGWIKIHRKMLDNPIVMKDSDHLAVWVYLLLNAAHKEHKALFKGDKIMLQPGQLITGRNAIADFLGISESKVKRALADFEGDQQIDRQRSNKNSLISLLNWDKYQFCDQQSDQQVTSKMTSKRPANIPKSDQQSDHKQEDKEDKKEKNDRYSLRSPEVDRTIEAWNDLGLRPIKKLSPSSRRYQNLVERIEDNGIDDVLQAVQKIRDSSYLQGKTDGGRMIRMFDVHAETLDIIGRFFVAVADVFSVFASQTAQDITGAVIQIIADIFGGIVELYLKFNRDISDMILTPFTENKDRIKDALAQTLEPVKVSCPEYCGYRAESS